MNILCIDDEPEILYILTQYLTMVGHTVKSALNGEEGLRELSSQHTPFDLVITDVRMPLMDGPQFLTKIRDLGIDTPVVVISGHQDNALTEGAKEFGIVAILPKPFSLDDVDKVLALVSR